MNKKIIALILIIMLTLSACGQAEPEGEIIPPPESGSDAEQEEQDISGEEADEVETSPEPSSDPNVQTNAVILAWDEYDAIDNSPADPDAKVPATQQDLETLQAYFAKFDPAHLEVFVSNMHIVEDYGLHGTPLPQSVVDDVFTALVSMEPTIIPTEEAFEVLRNPYIGGGGSIYVKQGNLEASVAYGAFFGIWTPDTGMLYFDMNSQSPIGAIDVYVDGIGSAETATAPTPAEPVLYKGQQITDMFAVDSDYGLTAVVSPTTDMIEAIDEYRLDFPEEAEDYARFAYMIYTGADKEYIYLGESAAEPEVNRCETFFAVQNNLRVHWLSHMDPYKISSIEYSGLDSSGTHSVSVNTTDPDEIMTISKALKDLIIPTGRASITEGAMNFDTPATLYTMRIKFITGVEYFISGYSDVGYGQLSEASISVHTSDLNRTMSYDIGIDGILLLRDVMAGIDSAETVTVQ